MNANLFEIDSMPNVQIMVSINIDDYLVVEMSSMKMLTSFGFRFRIFGLADIGTQLPSDLFPVMEQYGNSLFLNKDLVFVYTGVVDLVMWKAVIPIKGYFLYCLSLFGNSERFVWILCGRESPHDFHGAYTSSDGIDCFDSPELASLLLSGALREFV